MGGGDHPDPLMFSEQQAEWKTDKQVTQVDKKQHWKVSHTNTPNVQPILRWADKKVPPLRSAVNSG